MSPGFLFLVTNSFIFQIWATKIKNIPVQQNCLIQEQNLSFNCKKNIKFYFFSITKYILQQQFIWNLNIFIYFKLIPS